MAKLVTQRIVTIPEARVRSDEGEAPSPVVVTELDAATVLVELPNVVRFVLPKAELAELVSLLK